MNAWWRSDEGSVSAFVVPFVLGVMVLAGLVLDGGLALAAKVRANGLAESAARAGAQKIDLEAYRERGVLRLAPEDAAQAARAYLDQSAQDGTATATAEEVTVTVTTAHPTQLLGLIGISTLTVRSSARAEPHITDQGTPP